MNISKRKTILGIVLPVFIVMLVVLIVVYMAKVLDKSVYSERKELLMRLSESSANIINYDIASGQKIQEMLVDAVLYDIPEFDSVEKYFEHICTRSDYISYPFFLVDSSGKYYSSDGIVGKIVDMTYYTDSSDDNLLYISTLPHFDSNDTYLILRTRLPVSIKTKFKNSDVSITYCGLLYDIKDLDDSISSQFSGRSNSFIYDMTGQMLYKRFGIDMLLEGYNIFSKILRIEPKYGEDPETINNMCRSHQPVVVDMIIDGREYYFCSFPLEYNDWSVSFVIEEEHLTEISGSTFSRVILAAVLIAFLLACAMLGISFALKENQKQIEEIKNANELNHALEEASRAKSDFLSNMSHDIRTPINGIMGMTTIAKNVPGNPQKTMECLEKIDGASSHLLSLINDVLDMSRIERGKTQINTEGMDICTLCDNCINIIKGQMAGRELELSLNMNCCHTKVIGDPLHLRQIFINILGNAVKFTLDGGKIDFRVNEVNFDGTNVFYDFEIEDNGIGMSPEFLPKIFESFSQEGNKDRTNYKGTGLGMAITKQLTELMGGSITVESELNVGSKFMVSIPFTVDISESVVDECHEDADITGVRILLVEDNELNMDIATELLSDAGAEITPAENGQAALDIFAEKPADTFDLILMDIMMPVMNGYEATEAIRTLDREDAKTIPILAMTANAFEDDIKATKEAGMNAHLSKPIDIDEVTRAVAKYGKKQRQNI